MIKKNWKPREENQKNLSVEERLMCVRGFSQSSLQQSFFHKPLSDLLPPQSLKGMKEAVTRLVQAFKSQEKICIYGDFDLDGTSGLALLSEGFKAMGFQKVVTFQPLRLKDGYGFHSWVVEDLSSQGVSLIVTVDVGITAVTACEKARELGLDVIITDHHLPGEVKPSAFCIVNPNQGDCPSGLTYLSGAGVGFYLCRALLRALVDGGLVSYNPSILKELLDFVVIATVTDMVPMVGDNRPLVKAGLKQLEQTQRPGLQALIEMVGLKKTHSFSTQDVGIRLAPKLNALSRMELGLRPVDILLETDLDRARDLMNKIQEQNGMRVQLQQEGERLALLEAHKQKDQEFILIVHSQFHRGVIGLIATKIMKDYQKPTFIGTLDEEGHIVGSARLPESYPLGLTEALSFAQKSLVRFGGHFAAAGFELLEKQKDCFQQELTQFYDERKKTQCEILVEYDFDLKAQDLTLETVQKLKALEPFGQGFEHPLFGLKKWTVTRTRPLKGGHLKATLRSLESPSWEVEALAFGVTESLSQLLKNPCTKDFLVELQQNDFNGVSSVQLRIREARPAQEEF
jgi:single-stranded-DNA-specific exonuclease